MIDWSHVHPRFVALAKDADGLSYLYSEIPEATSWGDCDCWIGNDAEWGPAELLEADAFASFVPFAGNWRDSLELRPHD